MTPVPKKSRSTWTVSVPSPVAAVAVPAVAPMTPPDTKRTDKPTRASGPVRFPAVRSNVVYVLFTAITLPSSCEPNTRFQWHIGFPAPGDTSAVKRAHR
ncbi:hypothetical protein GCM10010246_58040 [Streptomyces cuspidosporus]|uniref:Uncharacterized protein n=1 Tax=Streptomyces cuspidosporus TaxID=66882 RepID=A0ABP5TS45_9ACTN